MINTSLLPTDGGIIALVFIAYLVDTLLWKPRIRLHDFPADPQKHRRADKRAVGRSSPEATNAEI